MATWWNRSSTSPPAAPGSPPAGGAEAPPATAGIRTRAQIEALISYHDGPDKPENLAYGYRTGIITALRWALGDTPNGPATGRRPAGRQPNAAELEAEDHAADEMIYGGGRQTQNYYVGAQHALYWVRGECEDTP